MSRFRRVGLGVVDQGLSSVSNVLFLVALARGSGVDEFGSVSFAYAVFAFGLAVQRVSVGTLISIGGTRSEAAPLAVSIVWAGVVSAGGVVLGQVVGEGQTTAYYLVVLASLVAFPQDLLRYVAVAQQRVDVAALSDGWWALVTGLLLLVGLVGVDVGATGISAVWLLVGAGGALVLAVRGVNDGLSWRSPWFRNHANELRVLGPDAVLASLAPLVLAFVVAQYLSLADVAAVRGAGTLLGPVAMLFSALPLVLLPEMARLLGEDRFRLGVAQALVMALVVCTWGGVLALVPDRLGESVLGASWAGARAVLFWSVLELSIWALASGPIALLGTYRRWGALLGVRLLYLVTVACALSVAVRSGDVRVVMAAMALAALINALVVAGVSWRHRSGSH